VTPGDDEARLRAAMVEAHRDDARRMPRFEATWDPARRPRTHRAWRWAVLSTVAAAAAVGVWLVARPKPAPWPVVGTRWVGPTDFLLETPDQITLRSLPTLDPRGLP
jgi:hypothetical protein